MRLSVDVDGMLCACVFYSLRDDRFFFFSSRRRHTRWTSVSAFLLNRSSDLSNIGISQSTFSVKVLNLFSRSRRKTNKRKSKHSAMLRNKETRHRMFIG